ncbi:auxin-responsive protein IAA20-like [Oryza brachyantha]|uniref:auxin-responsive protein IAA20-like n=1 Tax=Oryza brachyantha TaxID=4533 RepID=UPI0003EAD80D|nr:auxin-responsive protein IAA20-like [Oryza brachyantha]
MELELGLALPSPGPAELDLLNSAPGSCGKRGFERALEDDDDGGGNGGGDSDSDGEMGNKRRKLVGWPPVKCLHRRLDGGGGGGYVKVKMEGVAIGRKVDLSLHGSYAELLDTLHRMFPSTNQEDDGDDRRRHPHAVTYEDGEGDWMLVGDVPWEAFAKSVKRLKILVQCNN